MGHVSPPAVRLGLRTVSVALGILVAFTGPGGPVSAAGPADLVKDINTIAAGSDATPLVSAGGSLFLSACRGDGQRAIHAIDGPADAPTLLATVGSCGGSAVWWAVDVGDRVFFTLSPGWADLWVSDGTPEGTPGACQPLDRGPWRRCWWRPVSLGARGRRGRPGAVAIGRHCGRDVPGQGHPPG